jgi:5'-methylthioadenosine phosphorylase
MSESISLAIIGGSGLYSMSGLEDVNEYVLDTPFGKPSSPVVVGTLEGKRIAFLSRHGIGHTILPEEVNSRANIYALKMLDVHRVIGINACGSLREKIAPGHIVIPDQIFDFTHNRAHSFFGEGLVAHIGVADPFCSDLSKSLQIAVKLTGAHVHNGGRFIIVEGPRFSTRAESNTFRSWGMDIIGMTAVPEAFLAREAEMCYAAMAHVTDYDVWHINHAPVTVEMVIKVLNQNTRYAQQAIHYLVNVLCSERICDCEHALETAIITNPVSIPPKTRKKLELLVRKYLK